MAQEHTDNRPQKYSTDQIKTRVDLERHLDALMVMAPELVAVRTLVGEVPLRVMGGGFSGLLNIIIGQLLSVAAAGAIHQRTIDYLGDVTGDRLLACNENELYKLGLSRAKIKCLRTVAEAERDGVLAFSLVHSQPEAEARRTLLALRGVGPWTADLYLLSAAGHPDIFPIGDLALQKMVGMALGMAQKPTEAETKILVASWSPHRSAAARLLWRYFAFLRDREGTPI